MPINPVALFSNSQNNILDILNNGSNVISGMFDRAIQIGRDSVNNQMKQESDMLNMRAQETALFERRGLALQQNNEDAQRNARNAYEFDTKFAAQRADTGFDQTRQLNNDAFSQQLATDNYNLNSDNTGRDNQRADAAALLNAQNVAADNALGVAKYEASLKQAGITNNIATKRLTLAEQEALAKKQEREKKYNFNAELLNGDGGIAAEVNVPGMGAPKAPVETKASLALKLQAAEKVGNAPAALQIARQMQSAPTATAQDKTLKVEEAKFKGMVEGDTGAFTAQAPQVTRNGGTDADLLEAKNYDNNKFVAETQSALNMSKEQYVNMPGMKLSEEQKVKRAALWDYAQKNKGIAGLPIDPAAPPATATAPTTTRRFNPITGKIE